MNIIGITFDIFHSFTEILIYFSSCTVVIYAYYFVFSFINQIIYGKKIVESFEDGLRNLYWINTINKQDIKK